MKKLSETKFQHVGNIPKKETLVGCMIHVLAISFRTREQAEMEDRAGQIHKKTRLNNKRNGMRKKRRRLW